MMKKSFTHNVLIKINLGLTKWISKLENENIKSTSNRFDFLTPIDNVKNKEVYFIALEDALLNEDVKNIAITGSYGSGKSSIIKTFQKNHDEYKYLNISLASFKDSVDPPHGEEENLNRLIELSILQQIFYKEKHEDIPDSRFKRIKKISRNRILLNSFLFLIWGLSLAFLFRHSEVSKDFSEINNILSNLYFRYTALAISLIGCYYFSIKLVRIFNNSKLNKLNIQSADIEIGDNNDKSILNHHLDEILYFFEATKYNIVVIEDLDRFDDTEIFTKLRELNNLINGSKQIGRKIVFLYAIRDNMFQDKDRTKFFDFIIPIIPIINLSNSNEIIKNKLAKLNSRNIPTEDFIDDVSIFIEDMRFLTNICNEYSIYKDNLGIRLNQNNLFAMIIYKNLCPDDFAELHNGKGDIHKLITEKPNYIKDKIIQIDNSLSLLKKQTSEIEHETISDINELKAIYIQELIKQIPDIISIRLDSTDYEISELIEEENFKIFKKTGNFKYKYFSDYNGTYYQKATKTSTISFSDIENSVNSQYTYDQRESFVYDKQNNNNNKLKQEIEKLTLEKNDIKSWSLKKVLNSVDISTIFSSSESNHKRLISFLLVNGFIDENYYDYISYFHEGSITKQDWEFLQNVKSQLKTEYDFKLNKAENLMRKLRANDFDKDIIFNIDLLDFLLKNNAKYITQLKSIFKQLSNENEVTFDFVKEYIDKGIEVEEFIKRLSQDWVSFWKYVDESSLFTDQKKDEYLKMILKYADLDDIDVQSKTSKLKKYIESKQDFLSFINNDVSLEKIEKILLELSTEFISIENPNVDKELFNSIYKNNLYAINQVNIETILKYFSQDVSQIATANYTTIQNSNCIELKSYIEQKIDFYLTEVLFKLPNNDSESEDYFIKLLNNTNISSKNIIELIDKIQTKIGDVSLIIAPGITELLFSYVKIKPIWNNPFTYFLSTDKKIDNALTKFLNDSDSFEELSKSKISITSGGVYGEFREAILLNNDLSDESYSKLIKSVSFKRDKLSFENLSVSKIKDLVNNILNLTVANYDLLREHFANQHINLLEKDTAKFIKDFDDYALDNEDLLLILQSTHFTKSQKVEIILKVDEELLFEDEKIADKVCEIISTNSKVNIQYSLIKGLFSKAKNIGNRLKVFNIYFKDFTIAKIEELLRLLPVPYSTISIKGKRPEIGKSDIEIELVKNLLSIKYISSAKEEKNNIRINTKTK